MNWKITSVVTVEPASGEYDRPETPSGPQPSIAAASLVGRRNVGKARDQIEDVEGNACHNIENDQRELESPIFRMLMIENSGMMIITLGTPSPRTSSRWSV